MPKPKDHSLRVFEAAARLGSFAAAAEELGMTRAAVSYQVRLLEQQRGTILFDRAGNRVCTTPAGATLALRLAQAFRLVDDAVASTALSERRTLRVSAVANLAQGWLLPRLGQFRALHPDIKIVLDTTVSLANFTSDCVDVAIRNGYGDYPGLEVRPVMPLAFGAIVQRDQVAQGGSRDFAVLERLPTFALHRKDWTLWTRAMQSQRGEMPCHEPIIWNCWNLVGQTALAGIGIALAPAILYDRELASGHLLVLGDLLIGLQHSYWIVSRPEQRDDPAVAAFISWVESEGRVSRDVIGGLECQRLETTVGYPKTGHCAPRP